MKSYILKILVPFQSPDDPAARAVVDAKLAELSNRPGAVADIKLLEVYPDKPARPVNLFLLKKD